MDVIAVKECVAAHVKTAREDRKPTLVEASPTAFRGIGGRPESSRVQPVEDWQEKDRSRLHRALIGESSDRGDVEAVRHEADETVTEAARLRRRLAERAHRVAVWTTSYVARRRSR